ALGIAPGDEMITTPRTFIASASSAAIRGIRPVFADVDRDSGNVTPETVARAITPKTRAVLAVHLAGWPCDVAGIREAVRGRDIAVIEDCAQAHGATVDGRPVGGLADAAAWSFCQDKIMTTGGEGGALTLNDEAAWRRAWSYKDHGKSYAAVYEREHAPGFRWLHESLGTNWRMTETQAAIGRAQLTKMSAWTAVRRRHWNSMRESLSGLDGVRVPAPEPILGHAAYKFYAYVRPEALRPGWTRDRIMTLIADRGVPCFSGSCSEVYLEKAWDGLGVRPEAPLPVARELGETSLMFLVHPTLSEAAVARAGEIAREILTEATR
ncbi:DegT/DnrJ/EryC1/StrS aminotransferase family protein, partial [bacterium]